MIKHTTVFLLAYSVRKVRNTPQGGEQYEPLPSTFFYLINLINFNLQCRCVDTQYFTQYFKYNSIYTVFYSVFRQYFTQYLHSIKFTQHFTQYSITYCIYIVFTWYFTQCFSKYLFTIVRRQGREQCVCVCANFTVRKLSEIWRQLF